jgi:hypothetical protein
LQVYSFTVWQTQLCKLTVLQFSKHSFANTALQIYSFTV